MEDISLHILDIAENSIAANATLIKIRIIDDDRRGIFKFEIEDNGRGISEDLLTEVKNPFHTSRTTRNVGLGLSLLAQSAEETGGEINIISKKNIGTTVTSTFMKSSIDMKPIGDIIETLTVLIIGNPEIDFDFTYIKNSAEYNFNTIQLRQELEGIPLNSPGVIIWLRKYLKESFLSFMDRSKIV